MISVILLMAGKGRRMNYKENKILMEIDNKPLFMYPLNTFFSLGVEVICVISKDDEDKIVPLLPKGVKYTYGGVERGDSVYNGLKLSTGDYVLIHDAARALISKECINNEAKIEEYKLKLSNIDNNKAILTYLSVKDTIKEKKDDKLITLNREALVAAATPQCASREILLNAYEKAKSDNLHFTDDIALIEKYYPNIKIDLIEANPEDFKITNQLDYQLAKLLVERNNLL